MVGSSIIKRAFVHARLSSVDGVNLGFHRSDVQLWWQGKGGLRIGDVARFLRTLLQYEDEPNALILHVGGNDIGQVPLRQLRYDIVCLFNDVKSLLPNTTIIWSQILPRLHWRNEFSHMALERARVRLNSLAATVALSSGGGYVRYPEIVEANHGLFCDNVHLSHIGNDILLYRLHQAILAFFEMKCNFVAPPMGEFGPWLSTLV